MWVTIGHVQFVRILLVSSHNPWKGDRFQLSIKCRRLISITLPRRGRQGRDDLSPPFSNLSPRPRTGGDPSGSFTGSLDKVSIHAPVRGATVHLVTYCFAELFDFYSAYVSVQSVSHIQLSKSPQQNLLISENYDRREPPWEIMPAWGSRQSFRRSVVPPDQAISWPRYARRGASSSIPESKNAGCPPPG